LLAIGKVLYILAPSTPTRRLVMAKKAASKKKVAKKKVATKKKATKKKAAKRK
jgi:hypothetical protein